MARRKSRKVYSREEKRKIGRAIYAARAASLQTTLKAAVAKSPISLSTYYRWGKEDRWPKRGWPTDPWDERW